MIVNVFLLAIKDTVHLICHVISILKVSYLSNSSLTFFLNSQNISCIWKSVQCTLTESSDNIVVDYGGSTAYYSIYTFLTLK